MINNLLTSSTGTYIILGVLVLLMVAFLIYNTFATKKKREQEKNMLEKYMQVGKKICTIGGIYGTLVEINDEQNTFVLEVEGKDGTKTYLTMDKRAFSFPAGEEKADEVFPEVKEGKAEEAEVKAEEDKAEKEEKADEKAAVSEEETKEDSKEEIK